MNRLLFEKTGNGVWISHLDLMRLFQRAFKRGGLNLKHTQGFSPRALVSIALPLSVGMESRCEILDYELVDQQLPFEEIRERLNATMPDGIRVLDVYDSNRKIKDLTHLDCAVTLEYDSGIPDGTEDALKELFSREEITLQKRGKNGPVEQNIVPMILSLEINRCNDHEIRINCRICAQNPTLNPAQIPGAVEKYCPAFKPDFARICRVETVAADGTVFR